MADQIDEDDIVEFKEAFTLYDRTDEGLIKTMDLGKVMRSLGQATTDEEIASLLVKGNIQNNVINFEEFLELMILRIKEANEEKEILEIFKLFDKDGNGYISAQELKHIMNNLGEHLTDEEINDMIAEADENGDGQINYQEFAAAMKPK